MKRSVTRPVAVLSRRLREGRLPESARAAGSRFLRGARPAAGLLLACALTACGLRGDGGYSRLDGPKARSYLEGDFSFCSRSGPGTFTAAWTVPPKLAEAVEADLYKLSFPALSGRVANPRAYHRQYVGLTIDAKPYVYINAFPPRHGNGHDNTNWRTSYVDVCDGGRDYWGALYDPATGGFFDLSFNGPPWSRWLGWLG